jgi:hypothetical protein
VPVDQSPQYVTREMLAWCLLLLGSFFLAMSVVTKGQRWTMRDLLGLPTDRLKAFRHHIAQRIQAWLGFGCIFSGVSIHLYILLRKYLDAKSARTALEDAGKYLLGTVAAMVLLAVALHYLVKLIAKKSFVDLLALVVARHDVHLDDDQELLKEVGDILEVKREDDDTVESYVERVERAMNLAKARARVERDENGRAARTPAPTADASPSRFADDR